MSVSARAVAASAAAVLALSGCAAEASSGTGAPDAGSEAAAGSGGAAGGDIANCGFELAIEPTPERAVAIKSTSLELMLALGLSEQVVGAAFLDGPPPEELMPAGWEVPVLADELPGREALLAAEPDVILAGWESNLSADGIGTREDLAQLGLRSYVSPPACEFGRESTPLSFEDIFAMIAEVGTLFDVEDRAAALVEEQQAALDAVTEASGPAELLWFSSGEDAPFVGGGTGAPHMIIEAAGHSNVAGENPETWFSMPWEAFADSDPDVIVLVDAPWHSAEDKRAQLESHPAARHMRAVQGEQYAVVDFATAEAGVRNVEAVETLTETVAALDGPAGSTGDR